MRLQARALYPVLVAAVLALSLIRYDRTALALLLLFLVLARDSLSAAARARPDVIAAAFALFAWVAALCLWRVDRLALQFLVQYAGYAAMFLAAASMLAEGRSAAADRVLLLWCLAAVCVLLLVPRELLYSDFLKVFRPDEPFAGRWSLVFNNPIVYAIIMATGFCLAIAAWRDGRLPVGGLAALSALFLFQIAMSGSRNGVGVAGLGALALVALSFGASGTKLLRAGAVVLAAAIALGIAYLAATGRLTHVNDAHGFGTTMDVRLAAWRVALEKIAAHPLTGVGTEAILTAQPFRHAHNVLLTWAMEFGLVGLGLAILLLVLALRRAPAAALIPLIPALAGQMIDDFHFQRSFGLLTAVLLADAAFARPPVARTDRDPPASA